ncbi:MAG: hypothetical protein JW888_04475 [Pirellulales bacterium]|nr:hypothetical protein [Pirellulales bacterium]
MSGYHALRPSANDESRTSIYEPPDQNDDRDDSPMVLARVADFRAEPDEPDDEPVAVPEASESKVDSSIRSRLRVGGLVLVVGFCGFFLGRITSPSTPEDPEAWHLAPPAASVHEAPSWESQTLTAPVASPSSEPQTSSLGVVVPREQAREIDTSSPPPWTTPTTSRTDSKGLAAAATWGETSITAPASRVENQTDRQTPPSATEVPSAHTPWSEADDSQIRPDYGPEMSSNRSMTLPEAGAARMARRPDRPRLNDNPDAIAEMARRPTPPTQPPARSNTQPPPKAAADRTANGYSTPYNPLTGRADVSRSGNSNANVNAPSEYPSTGYPSTGYPNTGFLGNPTSAGQRY